MKRTNPIWGSISILIGVVIAILSLVRGAWEIPLLIGVFTVWGLWVIFTQLLPAWRSNRTYRRRLRQFRSQQESASNGAGTGVSLVLLHHVNRRITEHLQSVYPKAQWEWMVTDPTLFITQGGTGRIRVYGIPDYHYADVTLNRQGDLRCSLVNVAPLEAASPPNRQPMDPRVWYEFQGRALLENLINDLRSRGHSSLTLKEDGSICVRPVDGSEEVTKDTFAGFPEKVYWPRLAKVLEQEGLSADVQDSSILVSWSTA